MGFLRRGPQISSWPTMRFFLLWFCVLFLLASRLRAVSFPEDDEPLNTVDYHCKSSKAVSSFTKETLSLSSSVYIHFQHQRQILICLSNVLHNKSSAFFFLDRAETEPVLLGAVLRQPICRNCVFSVKKKKTIYWHSPSFTNLYSRP